MSIQQNVATTHAFLEGLGAGRDAEDLAAMFASDLSLEIPGKPEVLPWVGRSAGREAMAAFIRSLRDLTEPLAFDVDDILANENRTVVVGSLQTKLKQTGKVISSPFALIFSFTGVEVSRFQMLEDTYAVAQAAL